MHQVIDVVPAEHRHVDDRADTNTISMSPIRLVMRMAPPPEDDNVSALGESP
jgi:hypothetical protein